MGGKPSKWKAYHTISQLWDMERKNCKFPSFVGSPASEELDLQVFNQGGYVEAVREKAMGESISKVLYPNDETESGKELRLVQQYFFVACSIQDMISRFRRTHDDWEQFPEKVVVQLNDTYPASGYPRTDENFSWMSKTWIGKLHGNWSKPLSTYQSYFIARGFGDME